MKKPEYKLVAKASYVQTIAQLAQDIWHECYRREPRAQLDALLDATQSADAIEEAIDSGSNYFIVLMGGKPIGYFALRCTAGAMVCIEHLYLQPAWRGCGIGRDILGYTERFARGDNRGRLTLTVPRRSQETLTFFKRRGFRIVREEEANRNGWVRTECELEKGI